MSNKRYLGIKELSDYLEIKVNALYSWVYMKQMPYIKLSRLVKFDMDGSIETPPSPSS